MGVMEELAVDACGWVALVVINGLVGDNPRKFCSHCSNEEAEEAFDDSPGSCHPHMDCTANFVGLVGERYSRTSSSFVWYKIFEQDWQR